MYIFLAILANIQYKKVTPDIKKIYLISIGTSPIAAPSGVNGINIPTIINNIDEVYTALCALLWTNGIFSVLIMCIPTKFENML